MVKLLKENVQPQVKIKKGFNYIEFFLVENNESHATFNLHLKSFDVILRVLNIWLHNSYL